MPGMDDAGGPGGSGDFARLGRAESLRLLATVPVGRLIFTTNALPAVRLMNFVLADGLILMRTAGDSTAARKVDGMIVTFEADELDVAACSGWPVTVTGRAALVTDPDVAARYRRLPLVPWAAGVRDQFDDHHRPGRGPPRQPPIRHRGRPGCRGPEDREVAGPAPAVQARRLRRGSRRAGRHPVPSSGTGSDGVTRSRLMNAISAISRMTSSRCPRASAMLCLVTSAGRSMAA